MKRCDPEADADHVRSRLVLRGHSSETCTAGFPQTFEINQKKRGESLTACAVRPEPCCVTN